MIYLDNNATTALDPEVLDVMQPYLAGFVGNPSSRHAMGRVARRALDQARRTIADCLGASPVEIHFTSGATEANNLAILGTPFRERIGILINPADHPSCTGPVAVLEKRGHSVMQLELDSEGIVGDLPVQLMEETGLVVVQLANSETGAIQPVAKLARQLSSETRFHCDAVQGVGKIPVHFHELGVTTLSLSGHKLHGPAGIGALLVREGSSLLPLQHGGAQQQGLRPGTESVASIVGLAKAISIASVRQAEFATRLRGMRDSFEAEIKRHIPQVVQNGPTEQRLPHTSNLSFLGTRAEPLLIALDLAGICASAGTACSSGSMEPSTVLKAMRLEGDRLHSAIRFSFCRFHTEAEVNEAVGKIAEVVEQIRNRLAPNLSK